MVLFLYMVLGALADNAMACDQTGGGTLPYLVAFRSDSTVMEHQAVVARRLSEICRVAGANSGMRITVSGYTGEGNSPEYSLGLGARLADAVKKSLIQAGCDAKNIMTLSYGRDRPGKIAVGSRPKQSRAEIWGACE